MIASGSLRTLTTADGSFSPIAGNDSSSHEVCGGIITRYRPAFRLIVHLPTSSYCCDTDALVFCACNAYFGYLYVSVLKVSQRSQDIGIEPLQLYPSLQRLPKASLRARIPRIGTNFSTRLGGRWDAASLES